LFATTKLTKTTKKIARPFVNFVFFVVSHQIRCGGALDGPTDG
jgi:hypothetical protein